MKIGMNPVALVFFICVIVLGIADLGAVLFGGVDASLSHWVTERILSEKAIPYVPPLSIMVFTLGCVCGHLLYPMRVEVKK